MMPLSDEEAAAWDDTFRVRGATARSWICGVCGEDVDSSDLRLHLRGHALDGTRAGGRMR